MEVIQHIGHGLTSGLYILQLGIIRPVELVIGALHKGKKIRFDSGYYCYVGSAKGKIGSSTLASRLLRHSRRTSNRRKHEIHDDLQAFLISNNVVFTLSNRPKTRHWHIDYLLDDKHVNINKIFMVGNLDLDELDLVKVLYETSNFEVAVGRFGASDFPASSHLFTMDSESAWNGLISEIRKLIKLV